MKDKPPTPFPSEAQVTSFMARGVGLPRSYGVQQAPAAVVYREMPTPSAPLPDSVRRARQVGEAAEPPEPQPPPAPSETQLRVVLEQCVVASRFAGDNVGRANATHTRAVKHVADCRARLAEFDGLDQQITDATVEALRSGSGRPRIDEDADLRRRVSERDAAKSALAASERALRVLFDALTDAQADAAAATKAANVAVAALSHVLAEREAERILAIEVEIAQLREIVLAADVVGITPGKAMRAIQGDGSRYRRLIDRTAWVALRERLLVDPSAPLTLEIV